MDRIFTLASRANGATSSAYVAAQVAAHDHEQSCGDCGKPGPSVLMDDGWQGTVQNCPESDRLRRIQRAQYDSDHNGAPRVRTVSLTPDDQALLAAEVYDWLNARPGMHDQSTWVGPISADGIRLPAGKEPPAGITLCIAGAVCHLAGYDLHTEPVPAAVGPYRMTAPIPRTAARLLDLTEEQAQALFFTPSPLAMARLAELAHRP
ncbi:hypothetical protein [Streptomyces sp. NPDC020681]|uniref:hypothetical protein n=1 Tax=Streptomyces sp. NPDC020681 TaxID=3365083 RepID=UPI00378EBDC2